MGHKGNSFLQNEAWISGLDFLIRIGDSWPETTDLNASITAAVILEEKMDIIQQLTEHYSS